jgi:D-glycero-alpha-D-manno-heptose 1-phosphate guanylyltransferase
MQNLADMTAVILAGGLGTRLLSVVSDRPKVLAQIGNRPFVTFLLDQLVAAKTKEVVLCTGYMADQIPEKLGDTYKSLKIICSWESEPLGTGGALRRALPHLKSDPVLVMNGDSFVDDDLTVYVKWFFKQNRQASLLLVKVPNTSRYGKVLFTRDGRLSAFEEKGSDTGPGWINAGIYIMKKSLVASMPAGIAFSLEREFFPRLLNKRLYGFCSNGRFIDIGTPQSLRRAQEFFGGPDPMNKNCSINSQLKEVDK